MSQSALLLWIGLINQQPRLLSKLIHPSIKQ